MTRPVGRAAERQSEVPRLDSARLADGEGFTLAADCNALASLEFSAIARLSANGQFEVALAARLVEVCDHLSDSVFGVFAPVQQKHLRTRPIACKAFSSRKGKKSAFFRRRMVARLDVRIRRDCGRFGYLD